MPVWMASCTGFWFSFLRALKISMRLGCVKAVAVLKIVSTGLPSRLNTRRKASTSSAEEVAVVAGAGR